MRFEPLLGAPPVPSSDTGTVAATSAMSRGSTNETRPSPAGVHNVPGTGDCSRALQHVGDERARPQQHPRQPRVEQVLLDLGMPAVEDHRCVECSTRPGELDHSLDAGRPGRGDRSLLVLHLVRHVAAGQEQRVDAFHRLLERLRVAESHRRRARPCSPSRASASSRSRTRARTVTERSTSSRTTWPPTVPVAPVTRTLGPEPNQFHPNPTRAKAPDVPPLLANRSGSGALTRFCYWLAVEPVHLEPLFSNRLTVADGPAAEQ